MGTCRDCSNFKPAVNLEAGDDFEFGLKMVRGVCDINNNRRNSSDECGCGGYKQGNSC